MALSPAPEAARSKKERLRVAAGVGRGLSDRQQMRLIRIQKGRNLRPFSQAIKPNVFADDVGVTKTVQTAVLGAKSEDARIGVFHRSDQFFDFVPTAVDPNADRFSHDPADQSPGQIDVARCFSHAGEYCPKKEFQS